LHLQERAGEDHAQAGAGDRMAIPLATAGWRTWRGQRHARPLRLRRRLHPDLDAADAAILAHFGLDRAAGR